VRIAVITGGSSGIGAALARTLSRRNWHCVLLARGRERLERVAAEVDAEWEVCDVSDRAEVERVALNVGERHPEIDLLVNSAGIPAGGTFLGLPPEQIEQVTATNYFGGLWCLRAFLPALEAAAPSHVVNIVSVSGLVAYGSGPYAASKHAQLAFSRGIAPELDRLGIAVLTVNPGPVETAGFPQAYLLTRPVARRTVLQPADVAERIAKAIDKDRKEIVLPRFLRAVAIAESIAPGLFRRVVSRAGARPEALRGRAEPPR
jgi:uncharacterized protein